LTKKEEVVHHLVIVHLDFIPKIDFLLDLMMVVGEGEGEIMVMEIGMEVGIVGMERDLEMGGMRGEV